MARAQNKHVGPGPSVLGLIAVVALCGLPGRSSAVQLGGVNVPKQQFVVYLLIGNSNMAGWSEIADHATHPRGWHFKLPQQQWVPARAPLNPEVQHDGSHGGPGMPFLKEMVRRYPHHHIGVVQNAAAAATVRWKLNRKPQGRYQRGVQLYDTTIAAAKAVQKHSTLGGIVCMLGWVESIPSWGVTDTNQNAQYAKSLAVDVQNMVANMRADLGARDLPFLINKYEESAPKQHAHRNIVIAEIAKIEGIVPVSAVVHSEGPYVDSHHFDYAGQVKWGKAAAAKIANRGWFPAAELALGSSTLTFRAVEDGTTPSQPMAVKNVGKTVMAPVSTKIVYSTGSGWFDVTASGSGNSQALTNTVSLAGLAANTYSAVVVVSAAGALNNPQRYSVTLTVTPKPRPKLKLSPTTIAFSAQEGSSAPAPNSVVVANSGAGTLATVSTSVAYGSGSGWLTVVRTGSGNNQSLSNKVSMDGLTPNTYTATVNVTSADAANSPQSYTVSLTVTPKTAPTPDPLIAFAPTNLDFVAQQDGNAPDPQTVAVSNAGGKTLAKVSTSITYTLGDGWLEVSSTGSGNSQQLAHRISTAGLEPNTYSATVQVTAPGAQNSPQNYAVSLTITSKPQPVLSLSPAALTINAVAGSSDPEPQMIAVANAGSGTLNAIDASIGYAGPNTGWLQLATVGSGDSQSLENSFNLADLEPNTYSATVEVVASNAANSPQNYAVTLIVSPDRGGDDAGFAHDVEAGALDGKVDGGQTADAGRPGHGSSGHGLILDGGCRMGPADRAPETSWPALLLVLILLHAVARQQRPKRMGWTRRCLHISAPGTQIRYTTTHMDKDETTHLVERPDGSQLLLLRPVCITVVKGPDKGKELVIERTLVRVGTGGECELQLSDPAVSRCHFELRTTDRGYLLKDLNSTNGTVIGDVNVHQVVLGRPTVVELGGTALRIAPTSQTLEIPLSRRGQFGDLIGQSVAMRRVFALLEQIAPTDSTVLLEGESGTGKELTAQAIHTHSPRAAGPFVVVDCAAMPANLIEAELFGYERGAFTGAVQARVGALEEADGGTLLLDEIGELPIDLQPRLLRFLESQQIKPLGTSQHRQVDARVLAATNRRLEHEVKQGSFRADLFYRLSVVHIELPPIRERPEDILLLAHHFAQRVAKRPRMIFSDEIVAMMKAHDWPGNGRELRNLVERLALIPDEAEAKLRALVGEPPSAALRDLPGVTQSGGLDRLLALPFNQARAEVQERFECHYLWTQLDRAGGVVAQAAQQAQIPRQSFHRLMRRRGIKGSS